MLLKEEQFKSEIVCYFDSSNVLAVKYVDNKDMAIIYKGGRQYLYENVPRYVFYQIRDCDSQGKKIRQLLIQNGLGKRLYNEKKVQTLSTENLDIVLNLIKELKNE
jgi:hypothetical protein